MFLQFHERCCATSNCNDVSIRDEFTMHGGLLVAIEAGTVGRHGCKTILHRHNLDIVPSVLIQLRWTPSGAFVGSAPFGGLRYEAAWAFVVVLRLYFPLCKINWTRTVRRTRKNWYCSSCITKNAYWATVPRAVTPAELTFCYPSPLCTFLGMIVGIRVTDPRHTVLVLSLIHI